MRTDDLIAALGRNLEPVPPHAVERRLGLAALAALAVSLADVVIVFGLREDLASAPLASVLKALLVLGVLAAATPLALKAARPAAGLARATAPFLAILAASALAALVALTLAPAGGRIAALLPVGFPPCLKEIPIAAAPAGVLVFLVVRSLGPTRLMHAGAAAGAVAGGVGALAYCLFCPVDSAAYVLAWYPLAIALCAGLGALAGRWLMRW